MSRALVAGWFSFEGMGATAGDLLARDLCARWLSGSGISTDVALAPPFAGGVDWRTTDPASYDAVVFVCGPFGNGWPVTEFLEHFARNRLVGLNLSMLQDLEEWDPFDVLVERDSSRTERPDITFLSRQPLVPVVGVVLVHPQSEYPDGRHDDAEAAIKRLLDRFEVVRVAIDTRLDVNTAGLRTPAEVESLIARMDAVVTTRLHGTVLALKNGVPPLVIDPVAGGRKVLRHARTIGWKHAYAGDALDADELATALDFCLSAAGRYEAVRVRDAAIREALRAKDAFVAAVAPLAEG